MTALRNHYLSKAFTLLTGMVFLNMSFLLSEVSLLKLSKREQIENIAKLIFNGGLEEERDGETSGTDTEGEEVDLIMQQVQVHYASSVLLSTTLNHTLVDHYLHANHSLTFFPPPDRL